MCTECNGRSTYSELVGSRFSIAFTYWMNNITFFKRGERERERGGTNLLSNTCTCITHDIVRIEGKFLRKM